MVARGRGRARLCFASDRVTLRIARAWTHKRSRSARHAARGVRVQQYARLALLASRQGNVTLNAPFVTVFDALALCNTKLNVCVRRTSQRGTSPRADST
jgi:hypothetical protein